MNLKQLQDDLAALAAERGQGAQQNPKNLAMAVAADAGVLLALFRWLTEEQSWRLGGNGEKEAAAGALAEVLMHLLRLADELGIDLEAAVRARLAPQAPLREPKPAPPAAPSRPVETFVVPAPPAPPAPPAVVALPVQIEAPKKVESPAAAAPRAEAVRVEAPPAPPPEPKAAPKEAPPAEPPPVEAPAKKDKKPAAEATPSWLDGLIPARASGRGKKSAGGPAAAEPKAIPPEPPPAAEPTPAAVTEEIVAADAPGEEAAPSEPAPKREPARPTEKERYTDLDPEATKALVRSLARRVDGAKTDAPLLRELHDELETLRRALYSPNPKRSWLADSLITIRNMLEETGQHAVGQEIRAAEHIAQIERMLGS